MAFSRFRVNPEVNNQIQIQTSYSGLSISGALHRTGRKASAEEEELDLAFRYQQAADHQRRHAAGPCITCFDSSKELWEKWYLLL